MSKYVKKKKMKKNPSQNIDQTSSVDLIFERSNPEGMTRRFICGLASKNNTRLTNDAQSVLQRTAMDV